MMKKDCMKGRILAGHSQIYSLYEKPDLTVISLATNLYETAPINDDNDGNVLDNEVRQPLSRPDDHSEESDDNTMNSDEQCLLPQN